MNTDQLIKAMSVDAPHRGAPLSAVMAGTLAAGFAVSLSIYLWKIGVRPDVASAVESQRFLFKFVVTLTLAVGAIAILARLARPGAETGPWRYVLLLAPIFLAFAIMAELFALEPDEWMPALVGTNAAVCLTVIPILSVAPLVAAFFALRYGAVTRPRLAGAIAGLASGALAGTLYAAHCTNDSPLFVATWYSLAFALVAGAGATLGPRLFRW